MRVLLRPCYAYGPLFPARAKEKGDHSMGARFTGLTSRARVYDGRYALRVPDHDSLLEELSGVVSRCDPFQKNLKIYFWGRGRAARLLRCRFAAAGPNNVRQERGQRARSEDHGTRTVVGCKPTIQARVWYHRDSRRRSIEDAARNGLCSTVPIIYLFCLTLSDSHSLTMRAWPVARSIFDAPLCERSERGDNKLDNS